MGQQSGWRFVANRPYTRHQQRHRPCHALAVHSRADDAARIARALAGRIEPLDVDALQVIAASKTFELDWLLAALPVAWSRIYLGVHFPLDMVGAALVAVGGVIVAKRVWQAVGPRLVLLCEAVSRRMFSWLPARFTP